jgi:hypothetical protein
MTISVIESPIEGLVPPLPKSKELYAVYQQEVIGSGTARSLIAFLERSPKSVGVLIIDDQFDSMYIPPCQLSGGSAAYDGGIAVLNIKSPTKILDTVLPLGIPLMHELGHAKQYLEAPAEFEQKFLEATGQVSVSYPRGLTKGKSGKTISQLILENENVSIHEAPICDDLGLPFRKKYD